MSLLVFQLAECPTANCLLVASIGADTNDANIDVCQAGVSWIRRKHATDVTAVQATTELWTGTVDRLPRKHWWQRKRAVKEVSATIVISANTKCELTVDITEYRKEASEH